ncbi:MAG TPA: electron transfer flavoprotein-ubiquinone oxidoreductase [candidate division Zixibacteria bacterium]|nr:electron transfer flavoprotein-ubiquinone oxidoreductase [candidate division Zixibacteria bacterium]
MADEEREVFESDILIVGAGVAGLSCAYHLKKLINQYQENKADDDKDLSETMIVVLEKGPHVGAHCLSGAIMDPKGIAELMPDYIEKGAPLDNVIEEDALYYFRENGQIKPPYAPPDMHNKGFPAMSLNKFTAWLGEQVEAEEVDILTAAGGQHVLYDDDKVIGVRTEDKGLDKKGEKKPSYEPGTDIQAKLTLFAEGTRGNLTKTLVNKLHLQTVNPQAYTTGVKELWEIPEGRFEKPTAYHTFGHPLDSKTFGGGFIYSLNNNRVSLGFVTGLNYRNPLTDPHNMFQKYKQHPFVKKILEGGKMLRYGAKTIPDGGYYSMPKYYGDGFMIAGDSAGFLNPRRLKGIHLAIKSGMLAAETMFEALLADDFSEKKLKAYEDKVEHSWIKDELWPVRNFHQAFENGIYRGLFHIGMQMISDGGGFNDPWRVEEDHKHMKKLKEYFGTTDVDPNSQKTKFDNELTFNKLDDTYYSGTKHEEDQPPHLVIADYDICNNRCTIEYGNPCQHFCPTFVYEMEEDEKTGKKKLKLNPSNCVHCKTCDIADPYGIITWVIPQGGEGPNYDDL